MSYFDDASLVMIPSGYKTSKVYSVKPTDGSGDLTFSRSNDTATRVNSAGLIEKVRTNLALYSEQFDNAYWFKDSVTISANVSANPLDGIVNADKLVENTSTSGHGLYNSSLTPPAVMCSYSVYAKAAGRDVFQLVSYNGTNDAIARFNLTTGTVTTEVNSVGRIQSLGNGWYRCSVTHTSAYTASASQYWGQIYLIDGSGNSTYTGDGTSGILIFGAQFEASDFGATDYIATTSAAVSVGPVANVPRLDYLNSSCPRLLLEPQRTNGNTYSEQLDNAAWSKQNVTISANNGTSPDGYVNADKAIPNTTNGFHAIYNSSTTETSFVVSIFAKAAGYNYLIILDQFSSVFSNVVFNLSAGTCTAGGKIENYGNGWYRCSVAATNAGAAVSIPSFVPSPNGTDVVYAGDGTSGILLWGNQFESSASYATSYIPTLGAAVTRGADACSKTGISSLIGQTEGTLFGELKVTAYDANGFIPVLLKDATATSEIYVWFQQNGNVMGRVFNSASAQAQINTGAGFATIGGTYKFALAYKQNDFAFYINGQQIGTDINGVVQPTSEFYFTYNQLAGYSFPLNISQALLFKTRLTNAQLAELTTI